MCVRMLLYSYFSTYIASTWTVRGWMRVRLCQNKRQPGSKCEKSRWYLTGFFTRESVGYWIVSGETIHVHKCSIYFAEIFPSDLCEQRTAKTKQTKMFVGICALHSDIRVDKGEIIVSLWTKNIYSILLIYIYILLRSVLHCSFKILPVVFSPFLHCYSKLIDIFYAYTRRAILLGS